MLQSGIQTVRLGFSFVAAFLKVVSEELFGTFIYTQNTGFPGNSVPYGPRLAKEFCCYCLT